LTYPTSFFIRCHVSQQLPLYPSDDWVLALLMLVFRGRCQTPLSVGTQIGNKPFPDPSSGLRTINRPIHVIARNNTQSKVSLEDSFSRTGCYYSGTGDIAAFDHVSFGVGNKTWGPSGGSGGNQVRIDIDDENSYDFVIARIFPSSGSLVLMHSHSRAGRTLTGPHTQLESKIWTGQLMAAWRAGGFSELRLRKALSPILILTPEHSILKTFSIFNTK